MTCFVIIERRRDEHMAQQELLQPTPDGALSSAIADHVIGPAWLISIVVPNSMTFTPSNHCLLFYVDETGHEDFKDHEYPVFGLGGCAQVAGLCHRHIDVPWSNIKDGLFPEFKGRTMHASELRSPSQSQVNALADFFREGLFSRLAVVTRCDVTKPNNYTTIDAIAIAFLNNAAKIAAQHLFDSLGFIFESSERTEAAIRKAFSRFGLRREDGRPLKIDYLFLPKSAQDPGLEVADFIMHAAGGQIRKDREDRKGFRKDFEAVFRSVPRKMVEFLELTRIEEKQGTTSGCTEPGGSAYIPGQTSVAPGR